jgi:predicted glycosyltransferase
LGKHYKKKIFKLFGLLKFNAVLLNIARKFKPDIFLSHGSMYAAHVSRVVRKPHISFEDTGNMEQVLLYKPFTDVILTPDSLKINLGKRQIYFHGYKETAYLHPNYFKEDPSIYQLLDLKENEKYVLLRFASRDTTHDFRIKGLSNETKRKAVTEFMRYARVFISSEIPLPPDLEKYHIPIPSHKIHDVLYFATLLYSEGATMVAECAMLGTPSIYLNRTRSYFTTEQEIKYGLVFNYSLSIKDQDASIAKAIELLQKTNVKDEWQILRQKMLSEQIDLTAFMIWLVENYPNSIQIIKSNPDYQLNFK